MSTTPPTSSTPSPTRPRAWRRPRCCPSSRLYDARRHRRRHQRHLGGGPHPGPISGIADRSAARARQPGRAGQADAAARNQHHQAAQHQRFGGAAEGGHQGTAGQGLQDSRLPREPEDGRGEGHPRALQQVHRQRGESGAARRQLRPPRAQGGEGIRAQEPAQHGRMEPGLALARLAHAPRRLLPRRKVDDAGQGARREDGADHQERQGHRAQAEGVAAGARGDRLHVHEQEGAARILRAADPGRAQDRRDVLAAREGHHDEGVAPHRVRPLRQDLLPRGLREARRSCSRSWA